MERIQKLPFIMGCFGAIVTGFTSYLCSVDSQRIYIRMAGMMLIFFILGVYIRRTICSISAEVLTRKIKEQQEEKEKEKRIKEEEKAAAKKPGLSSDGQPSEDEQQVNGKPQHTNLIADSGDDSFEPLTVSRAIRTKING